MTDINNLAWEFPCSPREENGVTFLDVQGEMLVIENEDGDVLAVYTANSDDALRFRSKRPGFWECFVHDFNPASLPGGNLRYPFEIYDMEGDQIAFTSGVVNNG